MSGARLAGSIGMTDTPTIIPLRSAISADEVEQHCPGRGTIYACDFYVAGAEQWKPETGGLRSGRILNVDHHARLAHMDAPRTSTRLAVEHVRAAGVAEPGSHVVINHTDCDSVLSSGIMLGVLPPDDRFVAASESADHTGEPNEIADLLQALDETRKGDRHPAQYDESMRNLRMWLEYGVLEPAADDGLALRKAKREEASSLVRQFELRDGVAVGHYGGEIDGAFFAHLLEKAAVIMVVVPETSEPGRSVVKLRRGRAAPRGFSLHDLEIAEWDPNYGGRANAGSNKRGGGTTMEPHAYAERLRSRLRQKLNGPVD